MNGKDLKNIALQYSQDKYCSEDNETPRYMIAQIHAGRDGFIAGANWRINSVWNDNNVNPGFDCKFLIEDIHGNVYCDEYDADYDKYDSEIKKNEIKRWAYIEDLIPTKE